MNGDGRAEGMGRPAPLAGGVATLPQIPLARELVLASAGSGKTYHISKRLIGLLARGEPPESILASTFTRKAAGEILDRVLERLATAALDEAEAERLARDVLGDATAAGGAGTGSGAVPGSAGPAAGELGTAFWQGVLERTTAALHRLNVGTLDSFFMRVARAFAHELALPLGWRISDAPAERRILERALNDVLGSADTGQLVELVRAMNRSAVGRSVHQAIRSTVEKPLAVHLELDPAAEDPWLALERATAAERPGDIGRELELLARELESASACVADRRMAGALAASAAALRARDWDAFLAKGAGSKVLAARRTGELPTYHGKEFPPDAVAIIERALELARADLAPRLSAQAKALGRFVEAFHAAWARRRRDEGAYRFEDVTRLLGGPDPVGERGDLYFRLDARVRHILLDEFQDTSPMQWEALAPLVEEVLAGDEGERSAIIVADPKQSIYGWRGAESGLVLRVGNHFGLARGNLYRSWRSSPVVLDAVNRVFEGIVRTPVLADEDDAPDAAAAWAESFHPHVAAREELPGHVRVEVGEDDDGRGSHRPRLLRYAAERAAALHAEAPGFTIGVLTRTNQAVARLIFELRRLGIRASEEGGHPLTDSPAVASVLALLRLADHPGDEIARYHVARTPVGAVVGLTDPRDARGARGVAAGLRRRLLEEGYGATVAWLAASLRGACDERDRRRLGQLTELAWRWEPGSTLRAMDFVRLVEAERLEDATAASVRVMTVHRSKGLEFDIVVLTELDRPILGDRSLPVLPYRPGPERRITAVYPYVEKHHRPLFPEAEEAYRQHWRGVLLDALSVLYVGMTRARHALYIPVAPDGERGQGKARTLARIVRAALAPDVEARVPGQTLFESGDPAWHARVAPRAHPPRGEAADRAGLADAAAPVRLASPGRRTRILPRRSPSELGEGGVDVAQLLRLGASGARARGTVVHAWFQAIEWLDDGPPPVTELARLARIHAPELGEDEVAALVDEFLGWLAAPAVRGVLVRTAYPAGARVLRETRFVHRDGEVIVEGIMDRVVLVPGRDGGTSAAEILDFKTDDIAPGDSAGLAERAARYAPQLEAYRRGLAATYAIDPARIAARLVFVRPGVVVAPPTAGGA